MKRKLAKKLTLTRQTVSNLNEKEMTQSKGGAHTTVAGPRCDTLGGMCSMVDCTFSMDEFSCNDTLVLC